ncbi:MAG: radical SAM protein [Clostridia bacterium]|nr:radical SAM protein [Clostridia bacterium]
MKSEYNGTAYKSCRLCARECGVDRTAGQVGFCKSTSVARICRAALHEWEEPVISGTRGSGTIFFSGCSLGCVYCQNTDISRASVGRAVDESALADEMLRLESLGAHNINFVTPTHFSPTVRAAVILARGRGLSVPIVYNTSSFDSVDALASLEGCVDIYLADYKYHRARSAKKLSSAEQYPEAARAAIHEMVRQTGAPIIEDGIMRSGVIVRVLLLPAHLAEAKLAVGYLYREYGDNIIISLMSQYTPMPGVGAPLDRPVTRAEYDELIDYAVRHGVKNAFIQEGGAASESFIPDFDTSLS